MNRPHFIIGGAPKCATTALFDYLAQHPSIFASDPKEPHYFASSALGKPVMQGDGDEENYRELFTACEAHQVAGEGSTHYLHHAAQVAPLMAREIPDAKLIFCLRNPVARAYSHFLFRYSIAGPFTAGGVGQQRNFRSFIEEPEIFAMGNYATNLEIFADHFSAEQIHLVFFEDIVGDLANSLAQICEFLGVEPGFRFDLSQRSNETVYPRSPRLMEPVDRLVAAVYPPWPNRIKRKLLDWRKAVFFSRHAPKRKLEEADRSYAAELYRPSVEKLEGMVKRDLSEWLTAKKPDLSAERRSVPAASTGQERAAR